jgi:hypothetical protein
MLKLPLYPKGRVRRICGRFVRCTYHSFIPFGILKAESKRRLEVFFEGCPYGVT